MDSDVCVLRTKVFFDKQKQMRNSFFLLLSLHELKKERQIVSHHPHCSLHLLDAYVLHCVCVCAEEEEGGSREQR